MSRVLYSSSVVDNGHTDKSDNIPRRFSMSPTEALVYNRLWSIADPQGTGSISGASAATFLSTSRLCTSVLYEIWSLADTNNTGSLNFEEFCIFCRLVAHAQQDVSVTLFHIFQEPMMLPVFHLSGELVPHTSAGTSLELSTAITSSDPLTPKTPNRPRRSSSNDLPQRVPHVNGVDTASCEFPYALIQSDMEKYMNIFLNLHLDSDGLLLGEDAKNIMLRSLLPYEQLSKIWALVDRDGDGKLNAMEFATAMHLISLCRHGIPVPTLLPRELRVLLENSRDPHKGVVHQPTQDVACNLDPSWINNKDTAAYAHRKQETLCDVTNPSGNTTNQYQSPQKHVYDPHSQRVDRFTYSFCNEVPTAFHEINQIDTNLMCCVVRCLDAYSEKLRNTNDLKDTLRLRLDGEMRSLKAHLNRRLDFKNQVDNLKMELNTLLDDLTRVDLQAVSVTHDIDHYQDDILYLRRSIDIVKKEIDHLRFTQTTTKKAIQRTEEEIQKVNKNHRYIFERIEMEKELLAEQKNELDVLKKRMDSLQQEKHQEQATNDVIQDRLLQKNHECTALMRSRETESSILMDIQNQRIEAMGQKMKLINSYSNLTHIDRKGVLSETTFKESRDAHESVEKTQTALAVVPSCISNTSTFLHDNRYTQGCNGTWKHFESYQTYLCASGVNESRFPKPTTAGNKEYYQDARRSCSLENSSLKTGWESESYGLLSTKWTSSFREPSVSSDTAQKVAQPIKTVATQLSCESPSNNIVEQMPKSSAISHDSDDHNRKEKAKGKSAASS